MTDYPHALVRTIMKNYRVDSRQQSTLKSEMSALIAQLTSKNIDRSQASVVFKGILDRLVRNPERPSQTRAEERVASVTQLLSQNKITNFTPKVILDVGAGNSEITAALKQFYNLPSTSVYAIDQKLPNVTGVTPLMYQDSKIPLPDNSVDLVVMFVVLHHIPPEARKNILQEVVRVMAPNGYFVIREHDDDRTEGFYTFLDLVHIYWYLVYSETPDPLYLLTEQETISSLQEVGLHFVGDNRYSEPNPQRLYHALFTKRQALKYIFENAAAQQVIQQYVTKLSGLPPVQTSIPVSLQITVTGPWKDVVKQIALKVILLAANNSPIVNNTRVISAQILQDVINKL